MPRAQPIQTNFTSGEISPIVKGRVDIDRYVNGASLLENFIVHPQGGITRRSGTQYIASVKTASEKVRLQEFIFNETTTYILEFGDEYVRFYKDEAQLESAPSTPYEVATPYLEAELDDLYFAQSADILYIAHPNWQPRKLARSGDTDWAISTLDAQDGPYLDVDEGQVDDTSLELDFVDTLTAWTVTVKSTVSEFVIGDETGNKYFELQIDGFWRLFQVKTYVSGTEVVAYVIDPGRTIGPLSDEVGFATEVGQVITLTHQAFVRQNRHALLRVYPLFGAGVEGWYNLGGVYDGSTGNRDAWDAGTVALTMVDAQTTFGDLFTGIVTLSNEDISGITLTASEDSFVSTDVGRQIRLQFGVQWITATIDTYTSATSVEVSLNRVPPRNPENVNLYLNDGIVSSWRWDAWSDTNGWPAVVVFHEQRLCFASNTLKKNTVWMSKSADFENFEPSIPSTSVVAGDNAVTFTLADGRINQIEWMLSGPVLIIGTLGDEWQVKATLISEPITPSNVVAKPQSHFGTHIDVLPRQVENSTLFAQRSGNKIIELTYNFDVDSFVGSDLTLVSEHILRDGSGAAQSAFQLEPKTVMWYVRSDGQLACLTYLKTQQVFAWHRHKIGGTFGTGDAVVESIAIIPSGSDAQDLIYLSVKRTIDGATARYVEIVAPDFYPSTSQDKDLMRFVDSFVTYSGSATTAISGLDHLEGETVTPVVDGTKHPTKVVASGAITLDYAGSEVHTGLPYTSLVETLNPEIGMSRSGDTSQTSYRRIISIGAKLWNSVMFKYGSIPDAASTVSTASWTLGVVTVTTSGIHKFTNGMNADIREILPAAYNGLYQITVLNNTTFTYALAADPTSYTSGGKVVGAYTDSGSNFTEWNSRSESDPMDASPPIISGDRELSLPDGYDLTKTVIVKTDDPFPLTILALVYKMEAHAR